VKRIAATSARLTSAALVALAWLGVSLGPVPTARATPRRHRLSSTLAREGEASRVLPITVHLATEPGGTVVSPARLGGWIMQANDLMRPHGVQLRVAAVHVLPAGVEDASRRQQRRQLAWHAADDGTLHVFVVGRLDRERRATRPRVRGMWWRPSAWSGVAASEVILLSRFATPQTLAHEIGHALGLGHRPSADNLMCSCDRRVDARLDHRQGAKLRATARRLAYER
jgi:hypothetical protein